MYEGNMDKAKGRGFEDGRQEWVGRGGLGENGGNCTQTIIKNKNINIRKN